MNTARNWNWNSENRNTELQLKELKQSYEHSTELNSENRNRKLQPKELKQNYEHITGTEIVKTAINTVLQLRELWNRVMNIVLELK